MSVAPQRSSVAAGAGRRAGSLLAAVGPRDFARVRKVRSIARAPAEYRYRIARLHGVPSPSLPDQHIGWKAFKFPVDYVAGVVPHVQIIMNVRILPVHLGDY